MGGCCGSEDAQPQPQPATEQSHLISKPVSRVYVHRANVTRARVEVHSGSFPIFIMEYDGNVGFENSFYTSWQFSYALIHANPGQLMSNFFFMHENMIQHGSAYTEPLLITRVCKAKKHKLKPFEYLDKDWANYRGTMFPGGATAHDHQHLYQTNGLSVSINCLQWANIGASRMFALVYLVERARPFDGKSIVFSDFSQPSMLYHALLSNATQYTDPQEYLSDLRACPSGQIWSRQNPEGRWHVFAVLDKAKKNPKKKNDALEKSGGGDVVSWDQEFCQQYGIPDNMFDRKGAELRPHSSEDFSRVVSSLVSLDEEEYDTVDDVAIRARLQDEVFDVGNFDPIIKYFVGFCDDWLEKHDGDALLSDVERTSSMRIIVAAPSMIQEEPNILNELFVLGSVSSGDDEDEEYDGEWRVREDLDEGLGLALRLSGLKPREEWSGRTVADVVTEILRADGSKTFLSVLGL